MTLLSRLQKANRKNLIDMEQAVTALGNRNIASLVLGVADEATWEANALLLDMDLSYNMHCQDLPVYSNRLEIFRGLNVNAAGQGSKQGACYQR